MQHVLLLNTSLNGAQGNSTKLSQAFIGKLSEQQEIKLVQRDLTTMQLPHLSGEEMQAWMTEDEERTAEQHKLASVSDELVNEVKAADALVIGMPMYNFGIPSVFKAWLDRIARAGLTFRYTENGPVGLLENKKVYVLAARGGFYAGTDKDTQTQYLKNVFAFIGLTDVEFIYAEGFAMGEELADKAWSGANEKILELISEYAA